MIETISYDDSKIDIAAVVNCLYENYGEFEAMCDNDEVAEETIEFLKNMAGLS